MPRIPDHDIDRIKRTADLVAVIKGRGVTLRKTGKLYKACCPFHAEKTASFTVTPSKGLWHCFGCNVGGDVIRFVELMDKVGFNEAVQRLGGEGAAAPVPAEKSSSLTAKPPTVNPTQRTKLLARVAGFYQKCFANRPDGMKYLVKQRGITNVTHFKNYQIGYADGSLLEALPQDDDNRNLFKALGVLTDKGRELLRDCVVFPLFDDQGNVVNLYGRRMNDGEPDSCINPALFLKQTAHIQYETFITLLLLDFTRSEVQKTA